MTQNSKIALYVIAVIGAIASPFMRLYDFENFFYPALVEMAHFRSPYTVPGFYNPPWALLPLLPLGWMPLEIAKQAFFVLMLLSFMYVPLKLRLPWWGLALYMLSPPVLFCLWFGNLEWMVLLAFVVPGTVCPVLLALVKPQMGIGLAVYSMVKKQSHLMTSALWVLLIVLYSIVVIPSWANADFTTAIQGAEDDHINVTLWPLGLVVGIPLFLWGVFSKSKVLLLVATPFLSPYVLPYSWAGVVLGLLMVLGGCDARVDRQKRRFAKVRGTSPFLDARSGD